MFLSDGLNRTRCIRKHPIG